MFSYSLVWDFYYFLKVFEDEILSEYIGKAKSFEKEINSVSS